MPVLAEVVKAANAEARIVKGMDICSLRITVFGDQLSAISLILYSRRRITEFLMLNPNAKLVENLFDKSKLEMKPTRDGYGLGLVEAGEKDKRVVVLCADLTESTS